MVELFITGNYHEITYRELDISMIKVLSEQLIIKWQCLTMAVFYW